MARPWADGVFCFPHRGAPFVSLLSIHLTRASIGITVQEHGNAPSAASSPVEVPA